MGVRRWQHAATHCNTLQHTATHCNTQPHPATHCNTLQHTCNTECSSRMWCCTRTTMHTWYSQKAALYSIYYVKWLYSRLVRIHWVHRGRGTTTRSCNSDGRTNTATHCNTLQHTATHCNTLATHLQHTCIATHLQHRVGCPLWRWIAWYYWYGVATISRLLKIVGLFAKEPYKRDNILQKRPMILRSLLFVAIPYLHTPVKFWLTHNTLQHTATHLQHLQHTATHVQHTCNTLATQGVHRGHGTTRTTTRPLPQISPVLKLTIFHSRQTLSPSCPSSRFFFFLMGNVKCVCIDYTNPYPSSRSTEFPV